MTIFAVNHWNPAIRRLRLIQMKLYQIGGGGIDVTVKYGDQVKNLPLVIVKGSGPALFGRNLLEKLT